MRDVVRIPELFNTKPVIMRAYETAKKNWSQKQNTGTITYLKPNSGTSFNTCDSITNTGGFFPHLQERGS